MPHSPPSPTPPTDRPGRAAVADRASPPASRPAAILAAHAAALLALAGCAGDGEGAARLRVERDTVGDTVVVRTVAGSVWAGPAHLDEEVRIGVFEGADHFMFGDLRAIAAGPEGAMYAMDGQVPALRKYDPRGGYVGTLGRQGGGPGEYQRPDGGLAALPDGRVVLRDPANARLQLYSADGEPAGTIPIRGGFNTSNPLTVDTAGRVWTQILLDPRADVSEWRVGVVAYDPDSGEAVDTVPAPTWDYEEPRIVARRSDDDGTSTSINGVPFSPRSAWAFSPRGYMVGGLSTRYAVDQYRRDGSVVRIERVVDPVPVADDERANQEERARWNMRETQPDWSWNGPPIPDRKPPFREVFAGRDGRVWVLLSQPGERIPEDERIDEAGGSGPNPRPATRWREPVAFDVFEPDGTYLGMVRAPREFSLRPTPIFDGDRVWAVARDELDVQYLVRYRVTVTAPAADEGL